MFDPLSTEELRVVANQLSRSGDLWPDLGTGSRREWRLLVRTPRYEAWVIGWPSGGAIELHDHGG
jgi:hypothetical protein